MLRRSVVRNQGRIFKTKLSVPFRGRHIASYFYYKWIHTRESKFKYSIGTKTRHLSDEANTLFECYAKKFISSNAQDKKKNAQDKRYMNLTGMGLETNFFWNIATHPQTEWLLLADHSMVQKTNDSLFLSNAIHKGILILIRLASCPKLFLSIQN